MTMTILEIFAPAQSMAAMYIAVVSHLICMAHIFITITAPIASGFYSLLIPAHGQITVYIIC